VRQHFVGEVGIYNGWPIQSNFALVGVDLHLHMQSAHSSWIFDIPYNV